MLQFILLQYLFILLYMKPQLYAQTEKIYFLARTDQLKVPRPSDTIRRPNRIG